MSDTPSKRTRLLAAGAVLGAIAVLLSVLLCKLATRATVWEICTACGLMRGISYMELFGCRVPFSTTVRILDTPVSRSLSALGAACAGSHKWAHVHGRGETWSSSGEGSLTEYNARSELVAAFLSRLYQIDRVEFDKWRTWTLRADEKCCRTLDYALLCTGFEKVARADDLTFGRWWRDKRDDVYEHASDTKPGN